MNKFRVIDVEIQHEEDDNILDKKSQKMNKNNKIDNEEDEKEKFKDGNKKISEESEKLKN